MPNTDPPETDLAHADIGLVCALSLELGAFLDRCDRVKKYVGGEYVFRGGRYDEVRIVTVESGLGFARARRATQALVDAHTPPWILSAGFSGSLSPNIKTGDIVMADSIVDTHGHELTVDLHLPDEKPKGLHAGRFVTADEMVRTVEEKQTLGKKHQAIAVDMESLAVAQVARETKTKFLAVRVISDDMSADLPPEVMSILGETGSVRLGAALGAIWKRPASVTEMWKLRETTQRAAGQLATFLDGVVTQLYQASH